MPELVQCSFCEVVVPKRKVVRKEIQPVFHKLDIDHRHSTVEDGQGDHCPKCDTFHFVGLRTI